MLDFSAAKALKMQMPFAPGVRADILVNISFFRIGGAESADDPLAAHIRKQPVNRASPELSREERKSRKNLFHILRRVNGCFPEVCNQHFPADCMIFFLCFFHLRHLNLRIVLNFSMVVPFCQEISVKKCKAELCDLDKQRAQ